MVRKMLGIALGACGLTALALTMYLLGFRSGVTAAATRVSPPPPLVVVTQGPRSLQELIPSPGPSQPEQGQGQDCKPIVLFYYQGRLYQLQLGPEGQQGPPSSPPEYFPLTPYRGPALPGLPFPVPPSGSPESPGFQPVNPRF